MKQDCTFARPPSLSRGRTKPHPHPQYNRYIVPKNFKKYSIEHGNVVWGKNWDMMFPIEQLHKGHIA